MTRATILYDEKFLTDYDTVDVENPDRVRVIAQALAKAGYAFENPSPATPEDILLCHSESLHLAIEHDRELYRTALLAAGGAIEAAHRAMDGEIVFANIRPPGHHANPGHNWGFCFFNNIAVAIRRLKRQGAITTALILDNDLHFGDGT